MKLELYTDASLKRDFPEYGLRRGDIVKLVDDLVAADGTRGFAVEVFSATGETIDVHMIPASAVEALRDDELLCVRARETRAA